MAFNWNLLSKSGIAEEMQMDLCTHSLTLCDRSSIKEEEYELRSNLARTTSGKLSSVVAVSITRVLIITWALIRGRYLLSICTSCALLLVVNWLGFQLVINGLAETQSFRWYHKWRPLGTTYGLLASASHRGYLVGWSQRVHINIRDIYLLVDMIG